MSPYFLLPKMEVDLENLHRVLFYLLLSSQAFSSFLVVEEEVARCPVAWEVKTPWDSERPSLKFK
jgi:hypothetical protein